MHPVSPHPAHHATHLRTTQSEQHAIVQALTPVLERHEDGTASFLPGHSDLTVLAGVQGSVRPGISHRHVAGLRRAIFGNFPKIAAAPLPVEAADRIASLEARLDRVEAILHELGALV